MKVTELLPRVAVREVVELSRQFQQTEWLRCKDKRPCFFASFFYQENIFHDSIC